MAINFPPRPSENSDPWYSARENYDQALEAGINQVNQNIANLQDSVIVVPPDNLSEGDDLNDFLGNQLSFINSGNVSTIVNRPPDAPTNDGATVISYSGGSGTLNQEWTVNVGSDIGRKWIRSRSNSDTSWSSWHKLVFEEDLQSLSHRIDDLEARINQIEGQL